MINNDTQDKYVCFLLLDFLHIQNIKDDNFGAIQKKQFTTVRQDGERRYLPTILTESGSPRPTKSRPRVKYSGFNFARGSESPFVHCTQPYRRAGNPPSSGTREHSSRYHGFACQPLRGLVTSRNGELSTENAEPVTDSKSTYRRA